MPEKVTLKIPDNVMQSIQRVARATSQPIETLLLKALEASLPPLEGLPDQMMANLVSLEAMDDRSLERVMGEVVPPSQQERLGELLDRNKAGLLTDRERDELTKQQARADLVMLRKARAAVLLRFRGKRIPTLSELGRPE